MADVLLIIVFLLIGMYGYWIMGRIDRFIEKHAQEPSCDRDQMESESEMCSPLEQAEKELFLEKEEGDETEIGDSD